MADEAKRNSIQVYNSFFEDWNKNYIFYYTGKDCVLGMSHPDYIMKNSTKHKYARVAFYTFNEIGDDDIVVYINETLDITTLTSPSDNTHYDKTSNYKIHFEACGQAGRVINDLQAIKCSVTNCNIIADDIKTIPQVLITEDPYQDENNITKYGIGLWVDISNMTYILINVDKSLSANSVHINKDSFPSSYTATYLTNTNKEVDVNLLNIVDLLNDRLITTATDSEKYINDRLTKLEQKTKYAPHQYIQNTVVYNPTHLPRSSMGEENVQATSIRGSVLDRIVVLDPVNKTFSVNRAGIYALQLKNGFYLIQGESRLDLNVYINDEQIKEMRICSYLVSNSDGEEDPRKAIKNVYSSNVYVVELKPSDVVTLTAMFTNISDMVLENETMISVTSLQYNLDDSLIDNP